jgi:hypothetical protein
MSSQTVNIQVPEPLFQRLQRVAQKTHRTVEDVLATTINVALPLESDLPIELADELAAMTLFSDQALWAATATSFAPAQQKRVEQLTEFGDQRALTASETAELAQLLEAYDRSLLRRAHALAILAQRGHQLPNHTELAGSLGDEPESL